MCFPPFFPKWPWSISFRRRGGPWNTLAALSPLGHRRSAHASPVFYSKTTKKRQNSNCQDLNMSDRSWSVWAYGCSQCATIHNVQIDQFIQIHCLKRVQDRTDDLSEWFTCWKKNLYRSDLCPTCEVLPRPPPLVISNAMETHWPNSQ